MKFQGKTVIVTGAGSGIGKGVALVFGGLGANVIVAERDDTGMETEQIIKEKGGNGLFIKTDVRSEEQITSMLSTAMDKFGRIDILINNAGVSKFKAIFDLSVSEWDDILHTNLRSMFIASKEAARLMKKGGRIVNIASTRAFMSEPDSEAYAASKGGIVALTHALAASLGRLGINVNSISPGWIETGDYEKLREIDHLQHLSKRVGKPEDIAKACLYLCAPDNDFVTAENIVIDGGMTRKMIYES
ncbi:NAD(P)-dependent dehydrogenase (short-subunit alcohol dehydrogenase family) [Peribacillus deserti]|uniref:NAD(P)-dependent dehydrogenase (Short-subunit alcohol dehydrogenase family) n=1 Tax=Peribacillus deserti TaxID=673318 RepID=A0ABS2QJ37_9BACI|nr:SDR family oxidoreductase [Peribacillus deserti]MBM7693156.1 NAD(P)-dependent dehydrogenase (short-subunit alcohol dehydrogenase family) [Peribacillus deserti]